ncbi:MAG: VOC family protein [Actinobacteria bacterium]|nr:VOC family protein [Actinomycetota bacterium]
MIDPATTVGAVHLTVADLSRSVAFYRDAIGLGVRDVGTGRASLGVDDELVVLVEEPGAVPAPRSTGLFHFALLLPTRADLATWLAGAGERRMPLTGASDHFVSEAIYLNDPDGHGIEMYADRPRETWEGRVAEVRTDPLDVQGLLRARLPDALGRELPQGTRMGHVHLQVADIAQSEAFFSSTLGFDVMARYDTSASFLAAGGYHHHVGVNTWRSLGALPAPEGTARLLLASIVVPSADAGDRIARDVADTGQEPVVTPDGIVIREPGGTRLLVTTGAGGRRP